MICLFFGSFNPIHRGHIALARYAYESLGFDEVWLMLSPLNPTKDAKDQLDYSLRKALILDAIKAYPALHLVELERYMPYPLYTWRSVRALQLLYPREHFALLIGADNLLCLTSWYRWQELLALVHLYVYPRPHYRVDASVDSAISYTYCPDAPQDEVSSSEIRRLLTQKGDASVLLASPYASDMIRLALESSS